MAGGRDVCSKRGTWKDVLGISVPLQTSSPSHQHHDARHICFLLNCLWSTSTTAFCKVEICTPTADVLNPVSPCLATVLCLYGYFKPISYISFFFFLWQHHSAWGILVPWPGIKPMPPEVEAWSLNHWTAREFPPSALWSQIYFFLFTFFVFFNFYFIL